MSPTKTTLIHQDAEAMLFKKSSIICLLIEKLISNCLYEDRDNRISTGTEKPSLTLLECSD